MAGSNPTKEDFNVAKLVVVNYEKLLRREAEETARLFSACVEWGFFYLDLDTGQSDAILGRVEDLFRVSKGYFSQPLEEKMKDARPEHADFNICGYKPMGLDQGNVKDKKDGCEGLRLPLDLLGTAASSSQFAIPEGVEGSWPIVSDFMEKSYSIASTILQSLSDSIGLKDARRLELQHRLDSPSTSTVVLQSYPIRDLPTNISQGHFTHTDVGSISILFSSGWGLQVLSPADGKWAYVEPRPKVAVVNVGDSLRFLSGQRLSSCLHRVVPCHHWTLDPGYSVIFFLRPNNGAEFVDANGTRWTGATWLNRKFENYRREHYEQLETAMSTGQEGFLGLWEPCVTP